MAKFSVKLFAPVLLLILFLLSTTTTKAAPLVGKTETARIASEETGSPSFRYNVIIEDVKIIEPNPNVDQQQRNMIIQHKPRNTYVYHKTDNNNQAEAVATSSSSSMENVLMCAGAGGYCNPTFGVNCCRGNFYCISVPVIPVGGVCTH